MCYVHPRELPVGVCAHCLRERLLLLASKQGRGGGGDGGSYMTARPYCRVLRRVTTGSIVSVLAIGSSLLHRMESSTSQHHTHDVVVPGSDDMNTDYDDGDDDASIASLDGKLERNYCSSKRIHSVFFGPLTSGCMD
jgi:hypothetical protein